MKRNLDNLGRLVIPKEMRNQLGIKENESANIECDGSKIIITKPDAVDYKAIVMKVLEYIEERKKLNDKVLSQMHDEAQHIECEAELVVIDELLDILNRKAN